MGRLISMPVEKCRHERMEPHVSRDPTSISAPTAPASLKRRQRQLVPDYHVREAVKFVKVIFLVRPSHKSFRIG